MSTFFDDMVNDLTDAIAIKKEEMAIEKVFDVPAPTYIASETLVSVEKNNFIK